MNDGRPETGQTEKSWLERIINRAFPHDPENREELLEQLRSAERKEILEPEALSIIEGAMQVSDTQVRDVMIPRPQMVVVNGADAPGDFLPTIIDSAHSRFPVVGETLDEVQGILLAKDLLPLICNGVDNFQLQQILRPATIIPESKRLNVLLREFRENRNHMAIVIDEYGGVAGLVTIEDVLEEIVGEIEDETDAEADHFIRKLDADDFLVKALTPIDEFNEYFESEFSDGDSSAVDRGAIIGRSINETRRLVNEPPAMLYPDSFATYAQQAASSTDIEVEVWDEAKLEAEGCRAILAVGRGSVQPPRLVILRYHGGGDEAPLALVGKGVTFDSGGLSLKPSEAMTDMKCDMAGAATVLGAMLAIAKLGIKKNVIGFCRLAENMVSGDSYKLGDVIETRSGKTIEILNTDAEGRVVLADTLDVAVQHQPRAMVDLATLTGACMVALGNDVVGMMANDQSVCDHLRLAAETEGEPVWQLPMFELYDEKVKSKVADIKNVGEGRWGGAITAAKFLQNFVAEVPWVHLDIAGPAFADSPKPYRDAGATGVMVRTLVRWVESQP